MRFRRREVRGKEVGKDFLRACTDCEIQGFLATVALFSILDKIVARTKALGTS